MLRAICTRVLQALSLVAVHLYNALHRRRLTVQLQHVSTCYMNMNSDLPNLQFATQSSHPISCACRTAHGSGPHTHRPREKMRAALVALGHGHSCTARDTAAAGVYRRGAGLRRHRVRRQGLLRRRLLWGHRWPLHLHLHLLLL